MSKHTPGPWRLGPLEGNFVPIDADSHGELATVVWQMEDDASSGERSPTCEANAYLIAAAPELLEALEAVETLATRDRHDDINIESLRAVIAKARGEQ